MYEHFFKRLIDFILSLIAVIILSPLLLVLIILGAINMRGNPFFIQARPGKNEKIFKLIKFRTMNYKKDKKNNLLSDGERLTTYGKVLRSTSLDELPELINILKGDMCIVGPRPLLVEYLPLYNSSQRRRHDIRPGLTGLAQVNGRNAISWEQKFEYDVLYVKKIGVLEDLKIIFLTVKKILIKDGIYSSKFETMEKFKGNFC